MIQRSDFLTRYGLRRLLPVLVLGLVAACQSVTPTVFSSDIDELLTSGEAYSRALAAAPEAELSSGDIVALGYLERARLGIGSPYRLIAYALRDERLVEADRERLAYAILKLTLDGRGYHVDPAVLDVLRLMNVPPGPALGEYHLELIERTIAEAPSAQAGERAIRLGYMLASVERTIEAAPEPVITYVAALIADRRRAREDARDLLRAAAATRTDPLELMARLRRDLRLRVEQPALVHVTTREEVNETRAGSQLALSLRLLAQRLSAPASRYGPATRHDFWGESWLTLPTAARLEALASVHDYPAQAPIAVAMQINRDAFLSRPGLTPWQKRQRERFTEEAINEEQLVAAAARLRATGAGVGPRLPLMLLQSAAFLRGWNQEDPWFPGDAGPSARDLESRFGLASVSFDADVPESWRPYYRRMLGRSLSDLQRVMPTASVRGLNIRIGALDPEVSALALHDPRTRTLTLPPGSGAGTIAHEIAHDLDWQLARKRYNRRGGYATDLAAQRPSTDRLAASLAGLAASFARDDGRMVNAHDSRPAEVFARSTDWLVAAHLAAEGRAGGYLTSFQDAALMGYGTTRGPQIDGNAVPALLSILDQIAPVTPETRQWALDTYGPTRTLGAKELARAITSAAREGSPFERFTALEIARDRALEGLTAASCRMTPSPDVRQLVATRQRVIRTAVAASARGVFVDGVRAAALRLEKVPPREAVDAYLSWRLDGGPEPADSAVHELQLLGDELALRASSLSEESSMDGGGFVLNPERALCGGNPFASEREGLAGALYPFTRRAPREP